MNASSIGSMATVLALPPSVPAVRSAAEVHPNVRDLLQDYRLGLDGSVMGLTRAEFARAWRARYGVQSAAPMGHLDAAIEAGAVVRVHTRSCAVTLLVHQAYAMRGGWQCRST